MTGEPVRGAVIDASERAEETAAPAPSDGPCSTSPPPPRPGEGVRAKAFVAAVFLASLACAIGMLAARGRWAKPPIPGDTQDYDSIALNLAHGRGFGTWWDDPEWRAPYAANDADGLYDGILARHGAYAPTAYRPPLFPAAVAIADLMGGPRFLVWGLVHCGIVALAIALGAGLVRRLAGTGPAALFAALALVDANLRAHVLAHPYLTEGMTCLGVVVFAWTLAGVVERRTARAAAAAGIALGALVLVRTIFVLWYPLAALFVMAALLRKGGNAEAGEVHARGAHARRGSARGEPHAGASPSAPPGAPGRAAFAFAAFLAGALLVPAPWWVRNCVVLGRFMPLGTQGGINLPLGYSDVALSEGGVWKDSQRLWAPYASRFEGLDPLSEERERALFGQQLALSWMKEHPAAVPRLALLKLADLWRFALPGSQGWLVLLLALPGLALLRTRPALAGLWSLPLFQSAAVAATYGDGVRFLIPVTPVLIMLVAIGACRAMAVVGKALSEGGRGFSRPT